MSHAHSDRTAHLSCAESPKYSLLQPSLSDNRRPNESPPRHQLHDRRASAIFAASGVSAQTKPAAPKSTTAATAPAQTIKIAFIDPLSGPFAGVGANQLKHFQFVADLINAQQLAGPGVKLELVSFDNKASPQESLTVLKQVIDQGIRYVTQGNGSGAALALSDAIEKHNERNPTSGDPVS